MGEGRGPSLYRRCLLVVASCPGLRAQAEDLPDTVLLDLYDTMHTESKAALVDELCRLDHFLRILKVNQGTLGVLRYFQAVVEQDVNIANHLAVEFVEHCERLDVGKTNPDTIINHGLRLGGFFNDCGWYAEAESLLIACRKLCQNATINHYYTRLSLECCHRLLHAQSSYRNFKNAAETYNLSLELLKCTLNEKQLKALNLSTTNDDSGIFISSPPGDVRSPNFVVCNGKARDTFSSHAELNNLILRLFKEFALFFFLRSNYSDTYKWSMKALQLLQPDTPIIIAIDILRVSGKACVMMRKFPWAEVLIQQAVVRARSYYGHSHPKYAFTLLDYGFYFLNVDSVLNSVRVYEEALAIFNLVYCKRNIHLAIAHEDLAYALYVHEYASGRFYKAREHIDRAIKIIQSILPPEHLILATTKRVKALILEEIALDSPPGPDSSELLNESELLHKSALSLALHAFGEMNVQTAKHYGNLGRLYQSMRRFQEAESMQLRAIDIKKTILGDDDYEVGLSLGHLASLYNYHMNMYAAAEELYFRSISISLKSFGEEYSGLEYDYIGLIHVNNELKRPERVRIYEQLLVRWRRAREFSAARHHIDFGQEVELSVEDIKQEIFEDEDDTE